MSDSFDVIVIGAGPSGSVCAVRAAQLGGTCLNAGCIPSKALRQSSEHFEEALHKLAGLGVGVGQSTLDLARMQARKGVLVGANVKGVDITLAPATGGAEETLRGCAAGDDRAASLHRGAWAGFPARPSRWMAAAGCAIAAASPITWRDDEWDAARARIKARTAADKEQR